MRKEPAETSSEAKAIAVPMISSQYPQFDRENFGISVGKMQSGLEANDVWEAVDPEGDEYKKEGVKYSLVGKSL